MQKQKLLIAIFLLAIIPIFLIPASSIVTQGSGLQTDPMTVGTTGTTAGGPPASVKTFFNKTLGHEWIFWFNSTYDDWEYSYNTSISAFSKGMHYDTETCGAPECDLSIYYSGYYVFVAEIDSATHPVWFIRGVPSSSGTITFGTQTSVATSAGTLGYCTITEDTSGNLWILYNYISGSTSYIYVVESTSLGNSWGTPTVLDSSTSISYVLYQTEILPLDSGKLYAMWSCLHTSAFSYLRGKFCSGSTWDSRYTTITTMLYASDEFSARVYGTTPTVSLVYTENTTYNNNIVYRSWTQSGGWSPASVIVQGLSHDPTPSISVGRPTGYLYVVFTNATTNVWLINYNGTWSMQEQLFSGESSSTTTGELSSSWESDSGIVGIVYEIDATTVRYGSLTVITAPAAFSVVIGPVSLIFFEIMLALAVVIGATLEIVLIASDRGTRREEKETKSEYF